MATAQIGRQKKRKQKMVNAQIGRNTKRKTKMKTALSCQMQNAFFVNMSSKFKFKMV